MIKKKYDKMDKFSEHKKKNFSPRAFELKLRKNWKNFKIRFCCGSLNRF